MPRSSRSRRIRRTFELAMASIMVFQAAIDAPQGAAHPIAAFYMRPGKPVIARSLLAEFVVAGKQVSHHASPRSARMAGA